MKRIEQKVLKFISDKNLLRENDKVLVGLSGGPDSVFLLSFLKKYSRKLKISIGVIHINHLLRGKDASRDELFCKNLSENLSLKFYSVKENIKELAIKEKISVEEAGRKIRYREFERISDSEGYNKIATAHNADENAETILLNLIKGTGLKGLSGIPPSRNKIIRPLLVLTKHEILEYLEHYNLKYRIDLTNFSDDVERNFLRNQIIPEIQKRLNPSLSYTLFKSSEIFRNLYSVVKGKIDEKVEGVITKNKNHLSLSVKKLNEVENELRSEIIRNVFNSILNIEISFNDCSKILSLLNNQTGKSVQVAGDIRVIRERTELVIYKGKNENNFEAVVLLKGNSVIINDKELSIKEIGTNKIKYGSNKNLEYISGDRVTNNFLIRSWQPGDRFFPFGMKGSKKVSDFLNEQKVSHFKKKEQLLLLNRDKIVWVIGLRLDERFKVTPETRKIYQLCLS